MLARPDQSGIDPVIQAAMLAARPALRAFAISLVRDGYRADDLVQETLLRAMLNIHSFQPGTNMRAWLFVILRNQFIDAWHRKRREVELDADDGFLNDLRFSAGGEHDAACRLDSAKLMQCLHRLHPDQREALVLVGVSGYSYEEAAEICGCAEGTIKSRVFRAREVLARMLEGYQRRWDLPAESREEAEAWGQIVGAGALDDYALEDAR